MVTFPACLDKINCSLIPFSEKLLQITRTSWYTLSDCFLHFGDFRGAVGHVGVKILKCGAELAAESDGQLTVSRWEHPGCPRPNISASCQTQMLSLDGSDETKNTLIGIS